MNCLLSGFLLSAILLQGQDGGSAGRLQTEIVQRSSAPVLVLRNASGLAVEAYAVRAAAKDHEHQSWSLRLEDGRVTGVGEVIAPNGSLDVQIADPERFHVAVAVVYTDGTSMGDPELVQLIRSTRAGLCESIPTYKARVEQFARSARSKDDFEQKLDEERRVRMTKAVPIGENGSQLDMDTLRVQGRLALPSAIGAGRVWSRVRDAVREVKDGTTSSGVQRAVGVLEAVRLATCGANPKS